MIPLGERVLRIIPWGGFATKRSQRVDDSRNTHHTERRVEKVGRNDPCPCGSGRKYKKCCGSAVV
jgi:uncharacterized protein YecA (UPF0149 family)